MDPCQEQFIKTRVLVYEGKVSSEIPPIPLADTIMFRDSPYSIETAGHVYPKTIGFRIGSERTTHNLEDLEEKVRGTT